MENEIQKVDEATSVAALMAGQMEDDNSTALEQVGASDYVPYLTIVYKTSKAFENGLAKIGDLFLGGKTTLGNIVKMVILDYRVHCAVNNTDDYSFTSEFFIPSSNKEPLSSNEKYINFMSQDTRSNEKLIEGSDLLIWLPDHNSFAQFFCKASLARYGSPMYKASRGGRVIEVTGNKEEGKQNKSWVSLTIVQTQECLEGSAYASQGYKATTALPVDLFGKYIKQFQNPNMDEIVGKDETNAKRDR